MLSGRLSNELQWHADDQVTNGHGFGGKDVPGRSDAGVDVARGLLRDMHKSAVRKRGRNKDDTEVRDDNWEVCDMLIFSSEIFYFTILCSTLSW